MSSTSSNLPPLPTGVFSKSASALIDAPLEDVWNIILDFPSYKEWNPFVRAQTITDFHKNPLPDQTAPRPGQYLYLYPVHLPPTLSEPAFPAFLHTSSAFTQITTIDHEHHRAAWGVAGPLPHFLLSSQRWQALGVDEETGKTRYETVEVFSGPVAYLVKWLVGEWVGQGFKAQAEGLKLRAERLRKAT